MKPTLTFPCEPMQVAAPGPEATVPDLLDDFILQNALTFHLDEDDELFEGYGRRRNAYPYPQQNGYTRQLTTRQVQLAVLENDYLKATFLPELGGRLWRLWDKRAGRNLLYTNDVIRYSNLALRNAWFSGGVEWNVGLIGHTPLSNAPLFVATLQHGEAPVLRMYGYERVRGVDYQMDFWLGEDDTFLNARMRIVNGSHELKPMYWWSNMAVPEHDGGRIVVPADMAYACHGATVSKVAVPEVDGVDISRYQHIPRQVDYFFALSEDEPRYIANLNAEGHGLLQLSTRRLQSRKLFSWGNNAGSARWQSFLTQDAGRYVEIQAGLGKTQYGCLPMAPHTAWEWVERYGPVQVDAADVTGGYTALRRKMTAQVRAETARQNPEALLEQTKPMAKTAGRRLMEGDGSAAMKNLCRAATGGRSLSPHLDFGAPGPQWQRWQAFLEDGSLDIPSPQDPPGPFLWEEPFYARLADAVGRPLAGNWFAQYHYGVLAVDKGDDAQARAALEASLACCDNPWAWHAMAALEVQCGNLPAACRAICEGLALRRSDASYAKAAFRILLLCGGHAALVAEYEALPAALQADSRLEYGYIEALHHTGRTRDAYDRLCRPGFELADIREGDTAIGALWQEMHRALFKEDAPLPQRFNFSSL